MNLERKIVAGNGLLFAAACIFHGWKDLNAIMANKPIAPLFVHVIFYIIAYIPIWISIAAVFTCVEIRVIRLFKRNKPNERS